MDEAAQRQHLMRVAFRMLGTTAEAEDAVQEGYARWFRLTPSARADVQNQTAWLTTAVTRVCLDVLGSAAHRRELYVGPWLPEPSPAHTELVADPTDEVIMRDSVSTAMLRLMEHLTPAERVSFVLHDVFHYSFGEIGEMIDRSAGAARELASAGRKHLNAPARERIDKSLHRQAVTAFRDAASGGDLSALVTLLDPRVVLTSDGGGIVRAALNPIFGADKVARFLLGVGDRNPDVTLSMGETADGAAVVFRNQHGVTGVLNLEVGPNGITNIWLQKNPTKLLRWQT